MRIGYARVSSENQNLDRQIEALTVAGCDRIYAEKKSARSMVRRYELKKALKRLADGDELIVAEWDRATRSMMDGLAIMTRVHDAGASLKVLDRPWDFSSKFGRGLLAFLSALAEEERDRILKRAEQGRQAARRRGQKFERKPKLQPHQIEEAKAMLKDGLSCRAIGRHFGVHHGTVSRIRDQMTDRKPS